MAKDLGGYLRDKHEKADKGDGELRWEFANENSVNWAKNVEGETQRLNPN